MIEELVKEQDKWHRRYNDALIEIAKVVAENVHLEYAIKTLIQERDSAMQKIRCKDCKHCELHGWKPNKEVCTTHYHCNWWNHATDDDGWCFKGEKK